MISMWAIYDHPKDFPDSYVAREWRLDQGINPVASGNHMTSKVLDELRERIMKAGCSLCFNRNENDDPVILETWM
jgi:hypothetical protein